MIYVVGIGPGKLDGMTLEAKNALEKSDVIVGYGLYVDLMKRHFPQKQFAHTPMGSEIERCRLCFELALGRADARDFSGGQDADLRPLQHCQNFQTVQHHQHIQDTQSCQPKTVSMICSGDSGVYGMAEPLLSLQKHNSVYQNVRIAVIPGVTAATSGAALLGAPLNHDFCIISLSDLLTPWEIIEKRLRAAILGDFALAIYNPASKKRKDYLKRACKILLEAGAEKSRSCGYVKNIGRKGERAGVCALWELQGLDADMFTTVFIGNSQSEIIQTVGGPRLITKRGYKI